MQHLEYDMDELFRKAGEDYPLKEGADNWEVISAKVATTAMTAPGPMVNKGFKKMFIALLFLLLFLFTDLYLFFPSGKNYIAITNKKIVHGYNNTVPAGIRPATPRNFTEPLLPTIASRTVADVTSLDKKDRALTTAISPQDYSGEDIERFDPGFMTTARQTNYTRYFPFAGIGPKANIPFPGLNIALNNENRIKVKTYHRKFYYGILLGAGANAIKDQGFKKPGFEVGVICGLRLSRKLSVETGLLYEQKKYCTDARYFNMDIIGPSMPSTMHVMDVVGQSRGFEIPVRLRMQLHEKKDKRVFISGGLSSFIMTLEKNNYHVMDNGIEGKMISYYKNNRTYIGATIDLSVEYEKKIPGNNHLRIAPFVQLPLKGTGVGLVPVINTGLRFGLTKTTH
jgi:hypothetical protein